MIHEQLKENLKKAMKAKETVRLSVIRGLLAALTNEAVATGRKPDTILPDDQVLTVIKRAAKQRQDSIEQFTKGGRPELAAGEAAELAIIEELLPAGLDEAEIKKIATAKKAELGISDKGKIGILIGAIMKETAGRADGKTVKKITEELFN
ncbi:MAG: GatB/YqeY domain-containing protein [Candidatus Paceibacterota bacterium]